MDNYIVDKNEVLRYLGYKNQILDSEMYAKIADITHKCKEIATPKYMIAYYDVNSDNNLIELTNSNLIFNGIDIYKHLKGAKKCAIIAVTLGATVDFEISKIQRVNMEDAVIYDAVATCLIESVADLCESQVVKKAFSLNLYTNFRYSPGYGDFPLSIQKNIVNNLNLEKRIGLTITDSLILIPHKSVTAFIGMFDCEQPTSKKCCSTCNLYNNCNNTLRGENCV